MQAAEIEKGVKILAAGKIIDEKTIAVLASFGYAEVEVYRQPNITVLATGSEIVEIAAKPGKDQIRDSNSITISSLCKKTGANVKTLPLATDDFANLKFVIAESCGLIPNSESQTTVSPKQKAKTDILILSGGVSVGDYDFTKPALRELGAEIFFEKVALRPGKPLVFAKLNGCFIFGLPGNPVSVAVTFELFVRQAILRMQNAERSHLPEGFAVLTHKLRGAKDRDSYLPARVAFEKDARVSVTPLKWGGSSDFISFSKADCLIFVLQNTIIEAEEICKIVFLQK